MVVFWPEMTSPRPKIENLKTLGVSPDHTLSGVGCHGSGHFFATKTNLKNENSHLVQFCTENSKKWKTNFFPQGGARGNFSKNFFSPEVAKSVRIWKPAVYWSFLYIVLIKNTWQKKKYFDLKISKNVLNWQFLNLTGHSNRFDRRI